MSQDRPPFSLQDAWEHVADLYAAIAALFGAPRALAARLILMRKQRRDLLAWLAPVEALARRLLLLKALTLPAPNCTPVFTPKGKLVTETWRVRFSVWPYGARKTQTPAPLDLRRSGAIMQNALPLARRLEALRRVLENPEPALKRLTRLLAARRETAPAAFGAYRPPATPCAAALAEAQEQIDAVWNTS